MHHCINRLLSNEQFFRFSAIGVRKGGSWKETTEGIRKRTRKPEREGERSESEVEGARSEVASEGKDVWREGRKEGLIGNIGSILFTQWTTFDATFRLK